MAGFTRMDGKPKSKCRYWRIEVSIGKDRDGKRVKHREYFRGTYKQAKKYAEQLEAKYKVPQANDITLKQWTDMWLKRKRVEVQDPTYKRYSQYVSNILYLFGEDTKLLDITPADVEDNFAMMLTEGGVRGNPCRPSYVGGIQRAMGGCLEDALRRGYLNSNPVRLAKKVRVRTAERDVPTPEELVMIRERLDCRDGRQMAVYLTTAMGLRRGEALALRWRDVDLKNKKMNIRHSLRQPKELASVKTDAGRRVLPIPDFVIEKLEIRRAAAEADIERAKANGLVEPDFGENWDLIPVCCDSRGDWTTPNAAGHWWSNHRVHLGFTCSEHDLRHSYLTTLAIAGVPVVNMMALAGHKDPTVTLGIYSHSNMTSKEDAVAMALPLLTGESEEDSDGEVPEE